ncbi:MAG: hypothetical protein U0V87_08100 [Acidobacteriota bacterium]
MKISAGDHFEFELGKNSTRTATPPVLPFVGGAVRGGDLYGTFPTLELRGPDDAGDRGVWIPSTALDQYGSTLATWFGVEQPDLEQRLSNSTNFDARDLGFLST